MLVVTLAAQIQPVFVDLREKGGRWDLEVPTEHDEEDEDEEATKKLR